YTNQRFARGHSAVGRRETPATAHRPVFTSYLRRRPTVTQATSLRLVATFPRRAPLVAEYRAGPCCSPDRAVGPPGSDSSSCVRPYDFAYVLLGHRPLDLPGDDSLLCKRVHLFQDAFILEEAVESGADSARLHLFTSFMRWRGRGL